MKLLDSEKTELFESRFRGLNKPNEGEIAMSIHHPNIVETYEQGISTKGQRFIVMEYLFGAGLQNLIRLRDSRLEGPRLALIRQMAEAIQAVHAAGYIHRDICPRNFICGEDVQSLKLIDFGLTLPDQPSFRQPGNRTGTPMYMAPEIVRRRQTDRRVDVFAFGVTAYEMLTFQLPWPGSDTTGQAALAHDTLAPSPLQDLRPDLNPVLSKAVMRCLSANRDERPDSLEAFLFPIRKLESERG